MLNLEKKLCIVQFFVIYIREKKRNITKGHSNLKVEDKIETPSQIYKNHYQVNKDVT